MRKASLALMLTLLLLCACGPWPTTTPAATLPPPPTPTVALPPVGEGVLCIAVIWHLHQPFYYKEPDGGLYVKPWVRLRAAKDYVDMAALVEQYPRVHVTFNLTPSLLRQLEDIAAGARDTYWALTEVPADRLSLGEKVFLLRHFFDTNRKIIARFPRYQELLAKRGDDFSDAGLEAAVARWSGQDFLDLQVLFNLAWTDPDWLAQEPLRGLVEKGRGYSEDDKAVILGEHLRLVQEVVPILRRLQDTGQIEVTTTPYAHPILPLLVDTGLARLSRPDIDLPREAFSYEGDAAAQVQEGVALYQEHFGRLPRGMWPGEGSVAQQVVGMVSQSGIQWMASDEGVLAYSLGLPGFSRDSEETLQEADILYRPYYVSDGRNPPVAMVFRDHLLSEKIGFTYSGSRGEWAAQDLIGRLHAIRRRLQEEGAPGPHLVSIVLDGGQPWDYYDQDGKEFLHSLYRQLSEDPELITVTPSEYLAHFPDQPALENLWAGSWIDQDFAMWIGEEEENRAWEYLKAARDVVQEYVSGQKTADRATLSQVLELVYAAEGSDWFWWYGADQDSGDDASSDQQFRGTLTRIYELLGEEVPASLYLPIIVERPVPPDRPVTALFTPVIDGVAGEGEWDAAGVYEAPAGKELQRLSYGFDADHIYLRLDRVRDWTDIRGEWPIEVGVYLSVPGVQAVNSFSRYAWWSTPRTVLGFGAAYELLLSVMVGGEIWASLTPARGDNDWLHAGAAEAITTTAAVSEVLEVSIPFGRLGRFDAGDLLHMRAVVASGHSDVQVVPAGGAARIVIPDLGKTTTVLSVADPSGDDHGPGSYMYPLAGAFGAGCFDILSFTVGYDEQDMIFKFVMRGPVENVWDSPNGLSVQTFDLYIDQDGPGGGGARLLLPGRNAALAEGDGWEYAIWVEGWAPGLFKAGPDGKPVPVEATVDAIADPLQRKVTVRVPRAVLGDAPGAWRYLAVVLGQDEYPSSGVWRVREVEAQATQWRFGGGPSDTNHTRVIDLAWPAGKSPSQEEFLANYAPSQETDLDLLGPEDFAVVPMVSVP